MTAWCLVHAVRPQNFKFARALKVAEDNEDCQRKAESLPHISSK